MAIRPWYADTHLHEYEWAEEPGTCEWFSICECGFMPSAPAWRVLVTASRKLTDRTLVWQALGEELRHAESLGLPMVVIEGQCPDGGGDRFACEWATHPSARERNVWHDPFPANWKELGKRAGPVRNQRMVDAGADVCLAFPTVESRGTWDCVRRVEAAGIPVKVFDS